MPEPPIEYHQINQVLRGLPLSPAFLSVKRPKRPASAGKSLSVEDTPMSNEREGSGEDNRAIAEKVRQLARQTQIAQIQQELFDLADRLERMGEGDGSTSSGKS